MNVKKCRRLRLAAFNKQNAKCFYCQLPIWLTGNEEFARLYQLPLYLTSHLQCTAEHLVARQDKGKDTPDNIVAACMWCNKNRHKHPNKALDPAAYKTEVHQLRGKKRGHPVALAMSASTASRNGFAKRQ